MRITNKTIEKLVEKVSKLYQVNIYLDIVSPSGKQNLYQIGQQNTHNTGISNLYPGSLRERKTNKEMYYFLQGMIEAKEIN